MISRQLVAALAGLVSLTLAPLAASGAEGPGGHGARRSPALVDLDRGTTRHPVTAQRIIGFDGVTYDSAPVVVPGRNGDDFLGLDFDITCADGGAGLTTGMRRLARLARVISASGRRVVFTVAPNKEQVNGRDVFRGQLPQGGCDTAGMQQQKRVLDRFDDPAYVPIRRLLAGDGRQVYWKTDPHWTTVGASDWATLLANRLKPGLGDQQKYRRGTQTFLGYLNRIIGNDTPETVPAARPAWGMTVRTAKDSVYQWHDPAHPFPFDYSWNTVPAPRALPGHTLLLGDSFTLMGLSDLRPIFQHGRYQWIGNVADDQVAQAIASSDTVVIEVLQVFVTGSPIGQKSFRDLVRTDLRKADHG